MEHILVGVGPSLNYGRVFLSSTLEDCIQREKECLARIQARSLEDTKEKAISMIAGCSSFSELLGAIGEIVDGCDPDPIYFNGVSLEGIESFLIVENSTGEEEEEKELGLSIMEHTKSLFASPELGTALGDFLERLQIEVDMRSHTDSPLRFLTLDQLGGVIEERKLDIDALGLAAVIERVLGYKLSEDDVIYFFTNTVSLILGRIEQIFHNKEVAKEVGEAIVELHLKAEEKKERGLPYSKSLTSLGVYLEERGINMDPHEFALVIGKVMGPVLSLDDIMHF